ADAPTDRPTGFFVSAARGANDASPSADVLLQIAPPANPTDGALPLDGVDAVNIDRGAPAVVPSPSEPLATPVPVDPDATPLPPPTTALGQAAGQPSAATSRAVAAQPAVGGLVWPVPAGSI